MKRFLNFCFMLLWLSKQNIWVQVPCHGDISRFGCAYGFHSIWWLDLLFEFGHLDFVATENTTSPLKLVYCLGQFSGKIKLVNVPKKTSCVDFSGPFEHPWQRNRKFNGWNPCRWWNRKPAVCSRRCTAADVKTVGGASVVAQECQLSTDLKRQMSRSIWWWPSTWCWYYLYGIVTVTLTFHYSSMMGLFNITLHLFENDVLFYASKKLEAG